MSPALFEPIGEKFSRDIRNWAQANGVTEFGAETSLDEISAERFAEWFGHSGGLSLSTGGAPTWRSTQIEELASQATARHGW